jgi:Chaperone of endosialidase
LLLAKPAVNFSEKTLKLFWPDLERTSKDTTLSNNQTPMKTNTPFLILISFLTGFAFLHPAQAVVPPPDGGYPGFNTAEGTNALKNLTTGVGNAAVGWYSLFSNTDGSFNTALGAGTLLSNVGDQSTLRGDFNTAIGAVALLFNTIGSYNTATGFAALENNTIGISGTAFGYEALYNNQTGSGNTAFGVNALHDTNGEENSAFGDNALSRSTGTNNTAIGAGAGDLLVTGNVNVYIGSGVLGQNSESNTTYIRNVYDSITTARQVYVDANNKIGTLASTRRVKDDIEPMARASETILALKPVTFRYKKEIDRYCTPQFGLVAEEVAEINPNLVTRDREGKPETVRYDAVNAMLLNEFLKEHEAFVEEQRRVQEQECRLQKQEMTIARQQEQIDALTAGLQKVSAQVATSAPSLADSR